MWFLVPDSNQLALELLKRIYQAETFEEINELFDIFSSIPFPLEWENILSDALYKQRIDINQMWFVQKLREAGL